MSFTAHVDILSETMPDVDALSDLAPTGSENIPFHFRRSSVVAFEEFEPGIWTASIWARTGSGQEEAETLAQLIRPVLGLYAWAYAEDSEIPFDPKYGPRTVPVG